MGKYDELVERLKAQAESASRASIALAEAKSARQGDNPEGALDLYEWLLPAETIEWQAATAITTLEAELETLRPQVKVADDQWDAKCDELAAMKARGDRLAEFAVHKRECLIVKVWWQAGNCQCGLTQALTGWMDQHHGGNDADT